MSLFAELKRRNVVRVAVAYVVLSWLLLQIADTLGQTLALPDWTGRMVVLLIAIGFIPALIFSWVYELTPEGIKKEVEVDRSSSITPTTGRKLDIAVLVMLVAVAALYFIDPNQSAQPVDSASRPASDLIPTATVSTPSAIAVLPFLDLSPDNDQGYFADGIAEEILNLLARNPDLRVIARTSAFKFRGEDHDLREVGQALNANRILEGSVRTAGKRVRITAQLIDSESNLHLWSETYDRELTDIFAVQDEIATAISDALGVHLGLTAAVSTAPASTSTVDAYHLYLQGKKAFAERGADRLAEAIEFLEQAVEVDPKLDAGFGVLTLAHSLSPLYLGVTHSEAMSNVLASSDRALALNPDNVDALVGRGYFLANHGLRIGEGEALIMRALSLRPNDLTANNLAGDLYYLIGDRDRALEFESRAVELDPLDAVQQWDLARVYIDDRNWKKALDHARRASLLEPKNNVSPEFEITALIFLGELEAAQERIEQIVSDDLSRPGRMILHLCLIAAISEDAIQVQSARRQAEEIVAELGGIPAASLTLPWIAGDMAATAPHLQAVLDTGDPIFWYSRHWTLGLLNQMAEQGVELTFPPELDEFMQRRRGSPWESFRLNEEIAKARERRAARKS